MGPACLDYGVFERVVVEGADFIRINTAYANKEQYDIVFDNLKRIVNNKTAQVIFDIRSADVLESISSYNLEIIAVSFSESAEQLRQIQNSVPSGKIIAKIESERGVEKFDEIMDISWGVMIARGDLGRAVSLEKVPCLQKELSKRVLERGKFLIVATEMLLSMVDKPEPTRAEVSDVANAVFDGASAAMLSEETAIGEYPVESVRCMRRVIEAAEECV